MSGKKTWTSSGLDQLGPVHADYDPDTDRLSFFGAPGRRYRLSSRVNLSVAHRKKKPKVSLAPIGRKR